MNDFKVGDRVEYVGSTFSSRKGRFGVVTSISQSQSPIRVHFEGEGRDTGCWERSLILAPEPAPDVLTIPRAELPEVVERDGALWAIGLQYGLGFPAAKHRAHALAQLAVSEFLAAREKAEQEAADQHAAILNKRRDELAADLAPRCDANLPPNWYANVSNNLQRAIDRIIELEGQVKK